MPDDAPRWHFCVGEDVIDFSTDNLAFPGTAGHPKPGAGHRSARILRSFGSRAPAGRRVRSHAGSAPLTMHQRRIVKLVEKSNVFRRADSARFRTKPQPCLKSWWCIDAGHSASRAARVHFLLFGLHNRRRRRRANLAESRSTIRCAPSRRHTHLLRIGLSAGERAKMRRSRRRGRRQAEIPQVRLEPERLVGLDRVDARSWSS